MAEAPMNARWEGMTPAFTPQQTRALLDAPDPTPVQRLRDRAILAVGPQVDLRRSEIVRLKVRDLQTTCACDALRVARKGGTRAIIAIHPETAQRLQAYLEAAGHADDRDGPLFLPMNIGRYHQPFRRHLGPVRIDEILQTYVQQLWRDLGHERAGRAGPLFITTSSVFVIWSRPCGVPLPSRSTRPRDRAAVRGHARCDPVGLDTQVPCTTLVPTH